MSGGMDEMEEEQYFDFQFDPDRSNEENCKNLLENLYSYAEHIGAIDNTNDDGDKLAQSIMEAAGATIEVFEMGQAKSKTVAIIGDQGQGKSTLINLLLLQTDLDESQYGLVPTFGTPESGVLPAATRSQANFRPTQTDWEASILAIPYLREATAKALQPEGTAGFKWRFKAKRENEFKRKVEEIVQKAVNSVIVPVPGKGVYLEKHRSEADMKKEFDSLQKTLNACNVFPKGSSQKNRLHEHLLQAANAGDATSFTLTKLMWGPTYCALIRTKSEKQLIEEITKYPFEKNLALYDAGELSSAGSKRLLDMCARLRVLAGHDQKAVETDETIDRTKLPNFSSFKEEDICPEIREKAGKNVIIAGHGFHKEHDRVFVRQEISKYVQKSIGVIVEEVVFFAPSVLLKKGIVLIDPPGTADKNPLHRAVTHDAIQQADLLVLLSRATLQQGGALDFLREAYYLKRMLINPKTCKVLLLSTLDEKDRRLSAAEILEQWNDDDEDICKARKKVQEEQLSVKRFKSTLESVHKAILRGKATGEDSDSEDEESTDEKLASLVPSQTVSSSFTEVWGEIEQGVADRNLAFLPVAHTSLCLHKGRVDNPAEEESTPPGVMSQDDRATVLERTGGAKVLQQLLEMVQDKSKERMQELLQKLDEHKAESDSVQNELAAAQEELALLPSVFRDAFELQSKKKWAGSRDETEREILLRQYDQRMSTLQKNVVESMLSAFEEKIFETVGGKQIKAIKDNALNFIKNKKAKDLMKVLVQGTFSRSKFHDILFGGIRLQQNMVQNATEEFANNIAETFKDEFTNLLIDRIQHNLKGQTRTADLSPADKENIANHVTKWCKKEFNSTCAILRNGVSAFSKVIKNATFVEYFNSACKNSCADMLKLAKKIIDRSEGLPCSAPGSASKSPGSKKKRSTESSQWTKMGKELQELVKRSVEGICEDARREFAILVRDEVSDRADKFVQYFQTGRQRTKKDGLTRKSIARFLSVHTACHKGLEKKCARGQEDDDQEDAEAKERRARLASLLTSFSECVNDNLIEAEIERQQLMRWIRSQSLGLPSIMLQPGRPKKFAVFQRQQIAQNPLVYCNDNLAFRNVLEAMKADNVVPRPLDLSFEGQKTLCLYKDPVDPDDGDSLIRVMIQGVAGIDEPTPEEIKSMRNRLVCNTIAECSSRRTYAEHFKELSGEAVEEWGERMKENKVPGDVFVIESFCHYYKLNVLLITRLSESNVSFPAFRIPGCPAAYPQQNFICFVRFDGGVFCLVKAKLRIGGTVSTRIIEHDDRDKQDRKRHWRSISDNVDQNNREYEAELRAEGGSPGGGGSRARPSKTARKVASTPPHASSASSGPVRYPCPPGWTEHASKSTGHTYFFDPKTGKNRWAHEPPEEG